MSKKWRLTLFFLLFFVSSICYAQSGDQKFSRRLVWSGSGYVFRYTVEVDISDNGTFRSLLRESTASSNLIISLPAGEYRFRVIPHDILDRPGEGSQWLRFEVRPPSVSHASAEIQDITIIEDNSSEEQRQAAAQDLNRSNVFNGHRYELVEEMLTWKEANLEAQKRGGHLAVITSAEEQEFILELIAGGSKNVYWLGGQRTGNRWNWVTGEAFDYKNWTPQQPDNWQGGQNKMVIMRVVNPGLPEAQIGQWDDMNENNRRLNQVTPAGYQYENSKGFIIEYQE